MPQLTVDGKGYHQIFPLSGPRAVIGRAANCDVVLPQQFISGEWAALEQGPGGQYRFVLLRHVNPVFHNGVAVDGSVPLRDRDTLTVGPVDRPALTLRFEGDHSDSTMTVLLRPQEDGQQRTIIGGRMQPGVEPPPGEAELAGPGPFLIGRDPESVLHLADLRVSWHHARLARDGRNWRLEDLNSSNGTFVNGRRITRRNLHEGDVIRIGGSQLQFDGHSLSGMKMQQVRLDAHDLRRVAGGKTILDGVSVSIAPGQVFAIAGVSGAGKTTLLDALCGVRAPDEGRVDLNGLDLYRNFDAVQTMIGYTPQQDIVHTELTVRGALTYSARLRLPPDVTRAEIAERVDQVLKDLELWPRRDLEIRKLSGGQLKRVSIATELLADPGMLFLDEPTSGLDPGTTRMLMEQLKQLAAAGRTVVLVTHDAESLAACDRMVFMASGGRVAFTGTPKEALAHFNVKDVADIYRRVENEVEATNLTIVWRTQQQSAVSVAAEEVTPEVIEELSDSAGERARHVQRRSSLSQCWVLLQRRLEMLWRDRRNLVLLLAQAPAIGLLLALVMGDTAFGRLGALAEEHQAGAAGVDADFPGALASPLPLILAATAVWFGAINSAREIVKELPVFARERQAGVRIAPYMMSKLIVLGSLCAIQVAILLAIVSLKVDIVAEGVWTYGWIEIFLTLLLASLAGMTLGLWISALVSNADRAQSLVPIILIPQIIFVGGPLAGTVAYQISNLMITRWAIEAIKIIQEIPYRGRANEFSGEELALRWAVLAGMALFFFVIAGVLVRFKPAKAG